MKSMNKIVIKVGTSTLTQGSQQLSRRFMLGLVQQIIELHNQGMQIILVSSGAVATGKELFSSSALDASLASKQMFAAMGQVKLMQVWSELFSLFDQQIGQILLTKDDFSDRKKHITCDTLNCLLNHRIIPIINENDAIAGEACVGDNDNLAALVAAVIEADTAILLTDQEGLYTANPRYDAHAQLISIVEQIDEAILASAEGASNTLGTGGMATKIEAAHRLTQSGIRMIIASSARSNVLLDLAQGKQIGTVFLEKHIKG
jgi:glutamate 5-kinase